MMGPGYYGPPVIASGSLIIVSLPAQQVKIIIFSFFVVVFFVFAIMCYQLLADTNTMNNTRNHAVPKCEQGSFS